MWISSGYLSSRSHLGFPGLVHPFVSYKCMPPPPHKAVATGWAAAACLQLHQLQIKTQPYLLSWCWGWLSSSQLWEHPETWVSSVCMKRQGHLSWSGPSPRCCCCWLTMYVHTLFTRLLWQVLKALHNFNFSSGKTYFFVLAWLGQIWCLHHTFCN